MRTRTDTILVIMNILAWLALAGYIVKAGAILISYGVSIGNPNGAKNLYMGMNLYSLRQFDFWQYTGLILLMIAILFFQVYTAYLITRILSKIKLTNPFTMEIARLMERISWIIFLLWAVSMFFNASATWMMKIVPGLQIQPVQEEFLLVAGVVFVFSQIFKKGVEIQSENELTI